MAGRSKLRETTLVLSLRALLTRTDQIVETKYRDSKFQVYHSTIYPTRKLVISLGRFTIPNYNFRKKEDEKNNN